MTGTQDTRQVHGYELGDARTRVAWRKSSQSKASDKWRILEFAFGFLAIAATLVFLGFYLLDLQIERYWGLVVILVTAIFIPLYVSVVGIRRRLREEFEDEQRVIVFERLHRQETDISGEPPELESAKAWTLTQQRIDYYHEIALQQARRSFFSGQFAAYVGFAVVLVAAALAAFASNGTAAIAASVVGVAGAGLSGYIGGTFMKLQAEASAQMREFFLQPVESSRMLNAERLVQTIADGTERSKAVQEIVKAMMTSNTPKDS